MQCKLSISTTLNDCEVDLYCAPSRNGLLLRGTWVSRKGSSEGPVPVQPRSQLATYKVLGENFLGAGAFQYVLL